MADSSLDLNINIGANTQDFASQLQKAENLLGQFQSALKKSTNVGEINYLTTQINNLNGVIDNLNTKMSNVKKPAADSTNALSNFSRVAQDAPYGFMAISNNLNPMLESFQRLSKETGGAGNALKSMVQGLMSPAGLGVALGVVSSLIVAFGDDIGNFITGLTTGSDSTKQFKESLSGIGGEFTSAVEKVNKVEIAFKEYHDNLLTGDEALKIYNKQLGATLGIKSNVNEAEKIFKDKTGDYIEAQLQRALADSASKKAAEELLKQKTAQMEGGGAQLSTFDKLAYGGTNFIIAQQLGNKKLQESVDESQRIINNYKKIAQDAQSASDAITKKAGINLDTNAQKEIADSNKKKEQELKSYNSTIKKLADEALQEKIAAYEADIKAGMKWADDEMRLHEKMVAFYKKNGEIIKAETSVSLIRNVINKQDTEREKEADKTPFSEKKIGTKNTAIEREENRIKKFDKDLKDSQEQAQKYAQFMANTLSGAFNAIFDAMKDGKNPLQALGNYLEDLVKKFAAAAVQAAILQGIMMLINPAGAVAGGGFIGQFSKILGFAEGGIVSRPTVAMVGEGGQSEAIMPLNKLSNMMNSTFNAGAMSGVGGGSGSGQFVLKGNDLVLALQRSNYSLNLRRGNGI